MNQRDHDNSDQEGFFSEQFFIGNYRQRRHSSTMTNYHKLSNQSIQPHYLTSTGPLKKQPSEAFKTDIQEPPQKNKPEPNKKKQTYQQQGHPFSIYAHNKNYHLVYTRYTNQPINSQNQFLNHSILLRHVGKPNERPFKKFKQFQLSQDKQIKKDELEFDSKFECGNLHCAYKDNNKQEYVLFLSNDTNSLGYNQWFYYAILNGKSNTRYTFRIVNLKKSHSFFKYGSKPAIFSLKRAKESGCGWYRDGLNVSYKQSPILIDQTKKYYCLSFQLQFETSNDYHLIAMNLPYSYSKLINFITEIKTNLAQLPQDINKPVLEVNQICETLCGNIVPQLTISAQQKQQSKINKKIIIILARQHPGEVWSSYVMEGIIRQLLVNKSPDINWLLQNYIFKVYPMVNIDGVIYGNSRCDITGSDLNRKWKDTNYVLYPQIQEIKKRIKSFKNIYQVDICYDLHGHSKNYNIFTYGCRDNMYTSRILPYLINKHNSFFYLPSCTFGISKYKETTARAVIYRIIKTENVLTVQTSYYGSKNSSKFIQFTPENIFDFSKGLIKSTKLFLDRHGSDYEKALQQIKNNFQQYLKYSQMMEGDTGSDSEPEADQIDINVKLKDIFDSSCINIQPLVGKVNKKKKSQKPSKQLIRKKNQDQPLLIDNKEQQMVENKSQKSGILRKISPKTIEPKSYDYLDINMKEKKKAAKIGSSYYDYQQRRQRYQSGDKPKNFNELRQKFRKQPKFYNSERCKKQKKSMDNLHTSPPNQSIEEDHSQKKSILKDRTEDPDIIQNRIESIRRSDEFVRKYERFIPISMNINQKKQSPFAEDLYHQDQFGLINVLYENKKKIELQKIRRDIQKSTKIVQRQGRYKGSLEKSDNIVDFKAFKQNQKINKNIRKIIKLDCLKFLNHQ